MSIENITLSCRIFSSAYPLNQIHMHKYNIHYCYCMYTTTLLMLLVLLFIYLPCCCIIIIIMENSKWMYISHTNVLWALLLEWKLSIKRDNNNVSGNIFIIVNEYIKSNCCFNLREYIKSNVKCESRGSTIDTNIIIIMHGYH